MSPRPRCAGVSASSGRNATPSSRRVAVADVVAPAVAPNAAIEIAIPSMARTRMWDTIGKVAAPNSYGVTVTGTRCTALFT